MVTQAEDKARSIKEIILCLYNLHVSRPRILDYVNPAFHLISAEDLSWIAADLTARAGAEGYTAEDYWAELMNFWLLQPGLIADDASLAIKLHQFHRLVTPATKAPLDQTDQSRSPQRTRAYRRRSKRAPKSSATPQQRSESWPTLADIERVLEAAAFMGQHYGVVSNGAVDLEVRAAPDVLERAGSAAITKFTHELRLRIQDWAGDAGDRNFHWIYRNHRSGDAFRCHLALFVPYEYLDLVEEWLAAKRWSIEDAEMSVRRTWHNPQPRNPKAKQVSRLRFHWTRIRQLLATIDPDRLHWAPDGTRQPLRDLLAVEGDARASDPLTMKMTGVSHSLDRAARTKAQKNKMTLLSAFKDLAWDQIDTGWELDEYRDRLAEAAAREDQIRRIELIGDEPGVLAQQRHAEELHALLARWSNDPHDRPRTWTPWLPKRRETQ